MTAAACTFAPGLIGCGEPEKEQNGMRARYLSSVLPFVLLAACQQPAGETAPEPEPRQVARYAIADFLDTTSFGGGYFSSDNSKILVYSDTSGIFNAYAIPVGGGEPTQLTSSTEESIYARGYFPEDDRFLYSSDRGGDELTHVYVQELDGSVTDLTPGEGVKAQFEDWAADGASFFITTNERDNRFFDLYEYRTDGYERELVFKNDEGYVVSAISADGRFLALVKVRTRADSDVYVFDRETAETRLVTPHEGEVRHEAQAFSQDGASLYLTTDRDSEFTFLERLDLATGERQVIEKPDWDVMFADLSPRGTYLVVGVNNDARTELVLYETEGMTPVAMPGLDADITRVDFSRDESLMRFYASTGRIPNDLFVYDFETAPRQLTRSLSEQIDPQDLVLSEVVRFASFDGVEVPGLLYKPHQASPENKLPALVSVHGGPGGQSRVGYSDFTQYLVNHGYVVFAINNRGSSGYGKTFFAMDDRAHGEGDLDDCVAAKKMLADTGYVDPERIGIIGGSYGGYMVLAALAFRPDAFDVGVDIFGVANWHRTLRSIPPWWEFMRDSLEAEMGDFDDEAYLKSISPLFHAENIVKPLIVLQGANDPRVLQVESDEMVEAVKANGVPVEYIVFEDEGHGFRKKENQEEGYKAILDFLDRHLKKVPQSEVVG